MKKRMTGAHGLSADILTGRLLLNLDTEDRGEFYAEASRRRG